MSYLPTQVNDFKNAVVAHIGGIAATDQKYVFVAPVRCVVTSAVLICDTTTTGSGATAKYDFQIANLTQTLNLLSAAKSTNGAEITGDAAYDLGANQNLTLSPLDVLELQVTKTGSPTDLTNAEIELVLTYKPSDTYPPV